MGWWRPRLSSPTPVWRPSRQGRSTRQIVPGSLGTFAGLHTDAKARVLTGSGGPIPGLYAVGTDAASIMGGYYPAGGINLGPAMTFGYIAGRHVAGASAYEDGSQGGQA